MTRNPPQDESSFISLLSAWAEAGEIAEVYANREEPDKFCAGFIAALSGEHVLIAHIEPYGNYDGFIVWLLRDVYRVCAKSRYCRKLAALYGLRESTHPVIPRSSENLAGNVLRWAMDNGRVVTLTLLDSGCDDVMGVVRSLEADGTVLLGQYDLYGEYDGECAVRMEDITSLSCDTDREMAVRILMNQS